MSPRHTTTTTISATTITSTTTTTTTLTKTTFNYHHGFDHDHDHFNSLYYHFDRHHHSNHQEQRKRARDPLQMHLGLQIFSFYLLKLLETPCTTRLKPHVCVFLCFFLTIVYFTNRPQNHDNYNDRDRGRETTGLGTHLRLEP